MSILDQLGLSPPSGLGQGLLALGGYPQGGNNGFPQGLNSANTPRPGGMPTAPPGTQAPPPQMPGASFWGTQNPWAQNVTATQNGQPQAWAAPDAPNVNYTTPEAAQRLGSLLGANVVSQNLNGMASPGSGAPSAPMYGLDFGRGPILNPGGHAFALQRGDTLPQVQERVAAELNNTGWGGTAPAEARADSDGMWNYSTPVSTNTPNAQQAAFFAPRQDAGAQQYAANVAGQGNYGASSGGSQQAPDMAALAAMLRQMLGIA